MKALTFQAVEQLVVDTVDDPCIEAPTDAVLEVEVAGICGSDLHVYHGRETGLDAGTVMGHEYVGRVAEVGAKVTALSPGDRVMGPFTTSCGHCYYCACGLTCRCVRGELFGWREASRGLHGSQAELLRVPLAESTLVKVDESLSGDAALLVGDVLATGFYCAERASVTAEDVVAVIGAGPVGLMATLAAHRLGAQAIFVFDRVAERLLLAQRFGGIAVDIGRADSLAGLLEATSGRGADCVLEAVGSPQATRAAVDIVRPGGTISAVGVHTESAFAFTPGEAYDKNLTYRAGRCPARAYSETLLQLAAERADDLSSLVSHRLGLSDGVDGYELFAARAGGCTKVLLYPD